MTKIYDIIQTPATILKDDLPDKIVIDAPFVINGIEYICEERYITDFKVCEVVGDKTSAPKNNTRFLQVRRR